MQRRSTAQGLPGQIPGQGAGTASPRVVAALAGAVLMLTSACSGGGGDRSSSGAKAEPSAPQVTITPKDGTGRAKPEKGITIKVANGTLATVNVAAKGKRVPGEMSADKTSWRSRWTLTPGTSYTVSASAGNPAGKTTTATSTFKTLKAANVLSILSVTPGNGAKVGIGMPITITFNRPVGDRKAVEKSLQVRSRHANAGAWYWVNDSTVIFRTKKYWKANQPIAFTAHLAGVKSAKDTYGVADVARRFRIGDAHLITVNTKTHRLTVKRNGKVIKNVGISAGRGGFVRGGVDVYKTTSGVHLTMSKSRVERMTSSWMGVTDKKDPRFYDEKIPYAVRISNSGEYIHSMASTVWAQGRRNVSHGCINSPPSFAQWFFEWSYIGDVVVVTGSGRGLDAFNGWSYWQLPWRQWVKGSALDKAVSTVPRPTKHPTSTGTPGSGSAPGTSAPPSAPAATPSAAYN
ncbi:MAG TPA: Ig-like domain-containing protein [Streptosporangiaceae bacterium]|nr:Ig-like domain-containing protein [Streptosporangiaceae bacterium]